MSRSMRGHQHLSAIMHATLAAVLTLANLTVALPQPPQVPRPPQPRRPPQAPRPPAPPFPPNIPYYPWAPDPPPSYPPYPPKPASPPPPNITEALQSLENATDRYAWQEAKINWTSPAPCNGSRVLWTGVACGQDGLPTKVTLSQLNLTLESSNSSLPSALGWALSLKRLDLSNNLYGGTLPSRWSQLSALTFLDLSGNVNISGSVPASWATGMLAMNKTGSSVNLTGLDLCGVLPPGINFIAPTKSSPRLGQPCF